ncbi:COMM domain-containing protein 10 [Sinocyclocheilus rhinocerous]|uniref:COMM domain-containing protein 10 n=1 Tax=Sinocyclocheilus rhinocerous TaxID=307959 RepID=UPI0007B9F4ED|nr:PREDICTED: COMM domain-containing protein 10 [Sinocyclocheilus rhinocerous]
MLCVTQEERSFSEEEEEKLQSGLSLEKHTLHLLLETLSFILEQNQNQNQNELYCQAVYHNLKPASLRQQLENISVQPEKAEVFAQVWASAAPDVLQKIRLGIFAPNKLDLVGWQLNLQMATSARSRLKAPHAVLNLGLRTEDDTERLQDVFVEFNHQDLLDFYNQTGAPGVFECEVLMN